MTRPLLSLDIPARERPRYDPESPMRNPAFWEGAAKVRDESDVAARRRLAVIQEAVGHTALADIPEFSDWLAHGCGR